MMVTCFLSVSGFRDVFLGDGCLLSAAVLFIRPDVLSYESYQFHNNISQTRDNNTKLLYIYHQNKSQNKMKACLSLSPGDMLSDL